MKNSFQTPISRGRLARWGIGITLAGFVAGGGFAAAMATDSAAPGASSLSTSSQNTSSQSTSSTVSNGELNALLSASNPATPAARIGPLERLRHLGGMYGSFTFRARNGIDYTVAFERGTIESVTGSDVVVQAADGTSMTWLLVSDTLVHDHGKVSTSALADGQLIFVGGPVISGARDARLIVIRTSSSGSGSGSGSGKTSTSNTSVS
jgi:hypothetical protein